MELVARGLRVTVALLVTVGLVAGVVALVVGLFVSYGWLAPALLTLVVLIWILERWLFRELVSRRWSFLFFSDSPLWWRDWLPALWRWALGREDGEQGADGTSGTPGAREELPGHRTLSEGAPVPRRW